MFLFDEPTTGLHFHDIKRLLDAFSALIDRGHSVVIIEHNLDIIKCADYVIDMGPDGGDCGGSIVASGTPEMISGCKESITGKYLKNKLYWLFFLFNFPIYHFFQKNFIEKNFAKTKKNITFALAKKAYQAADMAQLVEQFIRNE